MHASSLGRSGTQAAIRNPATCGKNLRTVSMPGLAVSPARIFQSVVKGTPEARANDCIWECESAASAALNSAPLGMCVNMEPDPIGFGTVVQPLSVWQARSREKMKKEKSPSEPPSQISGVVWENLLTLMQREYGTENITRLGRDTGIKQGGAQRLKYRKDVGIGLIERVAGHFGIDPWQLLAPGLGESMRLTKDARHSRRDRRRAAPIDP